MIKSEQVVLWTLLLSVDQAQSFLATADSVRRLVGQGNVVSDYRRPLDQDRTGAGDGTSECCQEKQEKKSARLKQESVEQVKFHLP